MHLIIDLLGLQQSTPAHFREQLNLVRQALQQPNYTWSVLLHATAPERIELLRCTLQPELTDAQIKVFNPCSLTDANQPAINQCIYRALLNSYSVTGVVTTSVQVDLVQASELAYQALEQQLHTPLSLADLPNRPAASTALDSPKKPRLAYVSPIPPEETGIASYSAELLPHLAEHYQLIVINDQHSSADIWLAQHYQIETSQWLEDNPDAYDRVLYHIGNSPFHAHMLLSLPKIPGVVVLHDFYLGDVTWYNQAKQQQQHGFSQALYQSHGYCAVQHFSHSATPHSAIQTYPANFPILTQALGCIVHSQHAIDLAQQWYQAEITSSMYKVAHLRAVHTADKAAALQQLGYSNDSLIVSSFGFLGASKGNLELIEAWIKANLHKHPQAHLVFVGALTDPTFNQQLLELKNTYPEAKNIHITGFAAPTTYQAYLAASCLAVQLRSFSRGETSGTVLDCMSYGLPVIINQMGSMAELDPNSCYTLPAEFSVEQLSQALVTLLHDPQQRQQLGQYAQHKLAQEHHPQRCAARYQSIIEQCYAQPKGQYAIPYAQLAPYLAELNNQQLQSLAQTLNANFAQPSAQATLWLDVSVIAHNDYKTGIQRVVRALTLALLEDASPWRIEPVYLAEKNGRWTYHHAANYSCELLNMASHWATESPVDMRSGDSFLGLDLAGGYVIQAERQGLYQALKTQGVYVSFMVYDLIPVLYPDFYAPADSQGHRDWLLAISQAHQAICISQAVADDLTNWLKSNQPNALEYLHIDSFHLGANLNASAPSRGLSESQHDLLQTMRCQPSFLMVGTLEPRKGHWQTLKAFELLWQQGHTLQLVIVGQPGWMTEALVHELNQHPELGQRLIYLEAASDQLLEQLYQQAHALIAASYCEGFGLPLIEAAQYQLDIIARDIPVFREVAGEHAYYFSAERPEQLANSLLDWLVLFQQKQHPSVKGMPWLTWQDSAKQLKQLLQKKERKAPLTISNGLPQPQLLIDITGTYFNDLKTGIERVTRALLLAFLQQPPSGYRVLPVYLSDTGGTWQYLYATNYLKRLGLTSTSHSPAANSPLTVQAGDILIGLDIAGERLIQASQADIFRQLMAQQVRCYFLLHDILPIEMPKVFPVQADVSHHRWLKEICQLDGVICVSNTVAENLQAWVQQQHDINPNLAITYSHHGADIASSSPSTGLPDSATTVLSLLQSKPSFLMVGTIEPRKGYLQTLKAFSLLWKQGIDINLVIVGNEGWTALEEHLRRDIPDTVKVLTQHPEYQKRLFWLKGISDEYLNQLYKQCTCLIAASYGEGFGLPLIEAAQQGIPIIARDITIFREVANDHAFYFDRKEPEALAEAVKGWLKLYEKNSHPRSDDMPWLTWKESAKNLMDIVLGKNS